MDRKERFVLDWVFAFYPATATFQQMVEATHTLKDDDPEICLNLPFQYIPRDKIVKIIESLLTHVDGYDWN